MVARPGRARSSSAVMPGTPATAWRVALWASVPDITAFGMRWPVACISRQGAGAPCQALPFGSLAHRAGGRSGASMARARYGHPLRFYITPHCPQCPAVTALKLHLVPVTASRPSGEGNGTLCKVAYAIRRWSCAVAYVSCFASVPVGGPWAGHHDHEAGALRRPGAEFGTKPCTVVCKQSVSGENNTIKKKAR